MKNKIIVYFILLTNICIHATSVFKTIDLANKYAQTHEEYPDIDNKNWLVPDYNSFYKDNLPSTLDKILLFFRLKHRPLWCIDAFAELLDEVIAQRENNAYIGTFVQRVTPFEESKFILFSSLFGAFHSLTRCLQYLKEEQIIDNNFRITNKKHYIVFNCDAISISPYNLENITVILRLMKENPRNIIYIKGKHENKEYWLNYGLREELEIRANHISKEQPPLRNKINRLFNTLPLALYITKKENNRHKAIRISCQDRTYTPLNEVNFSALFDNPVPGEVKIQNIEKKQPGNNNIEITTIIKSTNTFRIFLPKTGIAKTPPDKGATSFVAFSSPTKSQRIINKFFYDAFTVIDIKKNFTDWTIALYRQDVREKLGIEKIATFNLLSGDLVTPETKISRRLKKRIKQLKAKIQKQEQQIQQKASIEKKQEDTIAIGTTLDTTGEQANIGQRIKKMIDKYINKVNKQGGIHNNILKFVALEDENQPKQAKNNIITLQKNGTELILSPLGGATTESYLNIIKEKSVAVLFPNTGYSRLRDPALPYLVNFGPGYHQVEQFAFDYVQQNLSPKKIAFFYQKRLAGESIIKIIKQLDPTKYVKTSYDPATLRIAQKAKKINNFKPDVLFIFSTPTTAIKLLKAIGAINIREMIIIGYRLRSVEFKTFLEENNFTDKYISIENLPDPLTSNLEICKEIRKENKTKHIDVFSAESYIATDILTNILQKGAKTKDEIIQAIEKIKNYRFKGLTLNFAPRTRQLSSSIWIQKGNNKAQKVNLE